MRVISGFLKSRIIEGDNIDGTRPTMDRVKTSLFGMINPKIKNSKCLDLFAGSGQLGIEAISNGASIVYFNDNNKKCVEIIKKNINSLKIDNYSKVYFGDYKKTLEKLSINKEKFDIIFLDPPYKDDVIDEILDSIVEDEIISTDGIVVTEYSDIKPTENVKYKIIKEKKYGDKYIRIYKLI